MQSVVAMGEGEVFVGGEYLFYKAVKSFKLIRQCGGAHCPSKPHSGLVFFKCQDSGFIN